MKKFNILLIFTLSLLSFVACSNDELKLNEGDLTSPVLSEFNCQDGFTVNASTNQKQVIGSIKWTEASFGIKSPVTYAIVADTLESMGTAVEVAKYSTFSEVQDITIEMLNKAAASMTKESKLVKLYVAVKAYLGATGAVGALSTEIKSVSFTCYFSNPKDVIYIVGDGLVGWGNDAVNIGKDLQIFFSDHSTREQLKYTYTGFFKGGKGLKFPTIAGDWGTAYGFNGSKLVANGGDNFGTPATDGIYTLSIDLTAMTATMVPYTESVKTYSFMGIVGDGANGWPDANNVTDILMTQAVPHVWVATGVELKAGKKIKIRADKDWAANWGAQNENDQELPFAIGKQGGPDISVPKDGKYYVALNDITGHYAIVFESDLPKK